MKKVSLLFIILAVALTACGTKVEESITSNLLVQGSVVSYDNAMVLNHSETIGMNNFNHVEISAPEGTTLRYSKDFGSVEASGDGTNHLIINLNKGEGPAQIEVFVTECPRECPVEVHFVHTSVP